MDPPLTTGASDALGNLIKTKFTLIIHLIIIDNYYRLIIIDNYYR